MNIRKGFVLRRVMGKAVVVAVGEASRQFGGMIKLNETAADLWGWLSEGATKEELIARLQAEYEVDEATATADVQRFVDTLQDEGLLEP